jgi:hypothetical protein
MKNVKTLKGLAAKQVHTTKEYDLFTFAEFNRATKDGYVPKKVEEFRKLIKNGLFLFELQFILVNRKGVIVEGNNRFQALKEENEEIHFIITDWDLVNGDVTEEQFSEILITINGVAGQWKRNEVWLNALRLKMPLAEKIEEYKQIAWGFLEKEIQDFKKNSFTPSKIIGVVKKDLQFYHGNKITMPILKDKDLIKKINESWVEDELSFIVRLTILIENAKNRQSTVRSVMKLLLKEIWDGKLTKEHVFTYVSRKGFECGKDAEARKNQLGILKAYNFRKPVKWESIFKG